MAFFNNYRKLGRFDPVMGLWCTECGGSVKVIACIEDPVVIKKILTHLMGKALSAESVRLPESWAPPQAGSFD